MFVGFLSLGFLLFLGFLGCQNLAPQARGSLLKKRSREQEVGSPIFSLFKPVSPSEEGSGEWSSFSFYFFIFLYFPYFSPCCFSLQIASPQVLISPSPLTFLRPHLFLVSLVNRSFLFSSEN